MSWTLGTSRASLNGISKPPESLATGGGVIPAEGRRRALGIYRSDTSGQHRKLSAQMQNIHDPPAGQALAITNVTATLPPRVLVHGGEGLGKTTFGSKFPAPVFLLTEDGVPAGVEVAAIGGRLTDFPAVLAALVALANEPHDFRTVVIDSLDVLEGLLWRHVCHENGWPSIESAGYGKGYVFADAAWRDLLAGLDYLRHVRGMIVVLIAHSEISTVNDPRATSYTSYQLRLHKRARGLVQDWCDAIGFLAPDLHVKEDDAGFNKKRGRADGGSQRWLHWQPRPAFTAKNRYGLPAKMPVPADFSYSALAEYFPQPPAVTAATQPKKAS
jgi:AAA domain